jgi:hypothetical protein
VTDSAVGWRRIEPSPTRAGCTPWPTLRTGITAAECPGQTAPGAPASPRRRDDRDRVEEDAEAVGVALEAGEPGQHVGLQRRQRLSVGRAAQLRRSRTAARPTCLLWRRLVETSGSSTRILQEREETSSERYFGLQRKRLIRKAIASQAHSGTQGIRHHPGRDAFAAHATHGADWPWMSSCRADEGDMKPATGRRAVPVRWRRTRTGVVTTIVCLFITIQHVA